ncbi:MAG: glycosyltransferase family 4 protein [Cyclobacteriaceae bacterium]
MKNRILFVGNFFDRKAGTITPSRRVGQVFAMQGFRVNYVSSYVNRITRIPDILLKVSIGRYDKLHLDVYSGNAFRIAETAASIGNSRKKPYMLTLRGGSLPEFYRDNSERIRKLMLGAVQIATPSKYLHNFFKENEPGIAIAYIPNMVDLEAFTPKQTYGTVKKLLWVRAFTPIYNPELPVHILYRLCDVYSDLTLTMVGPDKGLLSNVKELVEELELTDQVSFTGPVQNADLPEIYRSHDVMLNTTSYESFGMAVLEAGASGLPVISSQVGELPLIWHQDKDILFADKLATDPFAIELHKLLTNKDLAEKIGKEAVRNAASFDKEKIASQWAGLAQRFKEI